MEEKEDGDGGGEKSMSQWWHMQVEVVHIGGVWTERWPRERRGAGDSCGCRPWRRKIGGGCRWLVLRDRERERGYKERGEGERMGACKRVGGGREGEGGSRWQTWGMWVRKDGGKVWINEVRFWFTSSPQANVPNYLKVCTFNHVVLGSILSM